jgi:hypothetical protein
MQISKNISRYLLKTFSPTLYTPKVIHSSQTLTKGVCGLSHAFAHGIQHYVRVSL